MTKDEQIAALKQAYAEEMNILFTQHLSAVKLGETSAFGADLEILNNAYTLAADLINAQP